MNLGIFLTLGDSLKDMSKSGQDVRFKELYLKKYSREFTKTYVFSYANERVLDLPKNVVLIPNKFKLHRYIYGILMPILNINTINSCDAFRAFNISGAIPAVCTKIFFSKKFAFNFAYDYKKLAEIQGKIMQKIFFILCQPVITLFADKIFAANTKILISLPRQKTVYIPNGVDLKKFKPPIMRTKKELIEVLYVGRLEKEKNVESLVRAIGKLKTMKLTIVGSGSLEKLLKTLCVKLNIKVNFLKKIDNNKLPAFLIKYDIFVLPSLYEGHPKILLEAQAAGLACIASRNDGSVDIIKNNENGIICGSNTESIYKSIRKISKNKELASSIRKKARENIVRKFNLNKLLELEINNIKNLTSQ